MNYLMIQDDGLVNNMDVLNTYAGDTYFTTPLDEVVAGWEKSDTLPYPELPQDCYSYDMAWYMPPTPNNFHLVPQPLPSFPYTSTNPPINPNNEPNTNLNYSSSHNTGPTGPSTTLAPSPASGLEASRPRRYACSTCSKSYERPVRAEACRNRHLRTKPHRCQGACGNQACKSTYSSLEHLRRHQRAPDARKTQCLKCQKHILKQNIARHTALCTSL